MSQALLQIVDEAQSPPDQKFMERRRSPRHAVSTQVTAVCSTCEGPDTRRRICRLELLNLSRHGIGVLSAEPIDVGSHIAVLLPPHGPERGFDLYGTVVRCTKRHWGHVIGIELDDRPQRAA